MTVDSTTFMESPLGKKYKKYLQGVTGIYKNNNFAAFLTHPGLELSSYFCPDARLTPHSLNVVEKGKVVLTTVSKKSPERVALPKTAVLAIGYESEFSVLFRAISRFSISV